MEIKQIKFSHVYLFYLKRHLCNKDQHYFLSDAAVPLSSTKGCPILTKHLAVHVSIPPVLMRHQYSLYFINNTVNNIG